MNQGDVTVSVVLPCLNEEATIGTCLDKIRRTFEKNRIAGEIVVADNGSTDRSREIAGRQGARVVAVQEKGYGAAMMGGIMAARGKYVMMGDADDSYDFSHLPRFLERLEQGFDLVMGNRFAGGIAPGAMPLHHRYLGNPVLSGIGRMFFRSPVGDFHCGLRAFRREAILRLDLRTSGMEFASEMVVKAVSFNLRIAEVPTTLKKDGRTRPPHLRSWRDGWRHLRFMLVYSPRWLFLYPGAATMLLGLALMLWLLPAPRLLWGVIFDVQTAFYGLVALLIGFQAVLFSVLSKFFAIETGLIPAPERFDRLFRWANLETGLIAGLLLFSAGLVGSCFAVGFWGKQSFGPLDPSKSLRIVIPSAGALAIGCEIILSSFFLSTLGLAATQTSRRPTPTGAAGTAHDSRP